MKVVLVLFGLVAVAVAAPANPDGDAQVVRQNLDNTGLGEYQWAVETSNGISHQEHGELKNAGSKEESIAVRGEYQYIGTDGATYRLRYVADETGFHPSATHLPHFPYKP